MFDESLGNHVFLKVEITGTVSKELRCLVEFEQVWWEVTRVDVDLYSLLPPNAAYKMSHMRGLFDFGMNVKIRTVDGTSIRSQRPKGRINPWWNTHEMNCETFNHRPYLHPTIEPCTRFSKTIRKQGPGYSFSSIKRLMIFWSFRNSCTQQSLWI